MGGIYEWVETYYFENGRKGPLNFSVIFTTIIIVISKIVARIVRFVVLCCKYMILSVVFEVNIIGKCNILEYSKV